MLIVDPNEGIADGLFVVLGSKDGRTENDGTDVIEEPMKLG